MTVAPGAASAGVVISVSRAPEHRFSKPVVACIRLLTGLGVEGDAHLGQTVQHLSRVARDPSQPNLRQVHLIHAELHDELAERDLPVEAGAMGENITTRGLDLLGLPAGARLRIGEHALVEITGLRNPCVQLEGLHKGLLAAVLFKDDEGNVVRKAGVMGVVLADGEVRPGDRIAVDLPTLPFVPLAPV